MNESTALLMARCPTCHHRAMFHGLSGCSCVVGRGKPQMHVCPCTTTRTQLLAEQEAQR